MGAVYKRRSASRSKSQKAPSIAISLPQQIARQRYVREAFALGLLGLACFVTISLISYLISFSQGVPTTQNIMGPFGARFSRGLITYFGWCAFLPVVWLIALAFKVERETEAQAKEKLNVFSRFAGAFLAWAGAALLTTVIFGTSAGGAVGQSGISLLERFIGKGGAALFGVCLLLGGVTLLADTKCLDLLGVIRKGVFSALHLTLIRLPKLGFGVVAGSFSTLWHAFRETDQSPKHVAKEPKPRIRKSQVSVSDENETEQEDRKVVLTANAGSSPVIVKPQKNGTLNLKRRSKKEPAEESPLISDQDSPFKEYTPPEISLLAKEEARTESEDDDELRQKAEQIEAKLRDFNIAGRVTQVHPGPVITLFEFEPAPGVKVGRIAALQDDLSMSLKATSIRIIAPIPKRGTVGIEVPNKHRQIVRLRECLETEAFSSADSTLAIPLGKDTYGDSVVVDIATMPHLLMAGATGTGKSVCINAILLSLLYRAHPAELGLILIDPKVLELSIYEGIPHLRVPVVTDPRQAKAVLGWAVREMDRRYRFMQRFGVRNIDGYNRIVAGADPNEVMSSSNSAPITPEVIQLSETDVVKDEENTTTSSLSEDQIPTEKLKPLPKLVIVIDELADLMLTVGREIEELITRLAQKARAAGIHLIVATQRPSVDVITGLIKANFPARLSFRVSSRIDSRTILDSMGAEKLLGRGDMLFMLPGASALRRIHGAFVADTEVQKVVARLKGDATPVYDQSILAAVEKAMQEETLNQSGAINSESGEEGEYDSFYDKAVELVMEKGQASTSMIQRVFRIGYNRAARIIETMEREGIVGPMDGVKPREILIQDNTRSDI